MLKLSKRLEKKEREKEDLGADGGSPVKEKEADAGSPG